MSDFKSYYDANISLLDFDKAKDLFNSEWPIYTRTNDSAPTQYSNGGAVVHSMVSNGCEIEGTVRNSVIGRGVVIKKGAVVEDSVILPGVTIGEGSVIGAGSVVTKDIPAHVLAVGNPCRVVREITEEDRICRPSTL